MDSDFTGWLHQANSDNVSVVMSSTGYVIIFCDFPQIWCLKLQIEIALSTTEVEYIALIQTTREVLQMIELLKEINWVFQLNMSTLDIYFKAYEEKKLYIHRKNAACYSKDKTHCYQVSLLQESCQ